MSHQPGSDSHATNDRDGLSGCEAPIVRDHTLLRRVGKGSYGDVWLARSSTGAFRAVKVVYRRGFRNTRPFEREFSGIRKFEPVSRSHEGFIDILQVGINEDEEYFYYVMELGDDEVKGQDIDPATYSPNTLSKLMKKRERLPVSECLPMALALSRALMELHQNKLVHRDIKPSNIIFVNGCPKLADIGLVAPVDEARSYVGTEGFIPPEGPGTPQADIYSLGKVLYEIATGRDRQDFPDLPNLNELPDRDAFLEFNEVIIRACNGNALQRYQSAAELHADLLVLENGKSVRRLHTLERRFVTFKRSMTFAAIAFLIAAVVGYEVYSQWRRREETRQRRIGAEIAYGNAEMESGNYLGALPHFTTAYLLDALNTAHKSTHELRIGSLVQASPKLTHMWRQPRTVCDAEFSPNGKFAAISENNGKTYLYNLETRQLSEPFGASLAESVVSFSRDGSRIATSSQSGVCGIWNSTDLALVGRVVHPSGVRSLQFAAGTQQLLTSCDDGYARLWNIDAKSVVQSWKHGTGLWFANISHDAKTVVTAGLDHTARLWDASGSNCIRVLKHSGWVYYAAFSPDDTKLITACGDHKARVWDLSTGQQLFPELTHLDSVQSAEFSRDGKLIITASLDGTARLWRADTLAPLTENPILKHKDRITRARFDASGERVITAAIDGTVAVWDFSDCSKNLHVTETIDPKDLLATSEASTNRSVIRQVAEQLNVSSENIAAVFFSHHRNVIALRAHNSDTVEIWNAFNRKLISTIHTTLSDCIPNDNGTRMLGYQGNILHIWSFSSSTTKPLELSHANEIHSVAFNKGGDAVMVVSGKYILLWDATTGKPRCAPMEFTLPISHAEFSPDGTMIGGCCADSSFRSGNSEVFDVKTGRALTVPLPQNDGVLWITFSPDSKRVVTASEDFTARLWDPRTGRTIGNPMMHREKVLKASFSEDGKMVATIAFDRTMRIWNAETGDPVTPALVCDRYNYRPVFISQGVAIVDKAGLSRMWRFPGRLPTADDLNELAFVLSGSRSQEVTARHTKYVDEEWSNLRARYPDLFAVGRPPATSP